MEEWKEKVEVTHVATVINQVVKSELGGAL